MVAGVAWAALILALLSSITVINNNCHSARDERDEDPRVAGDIDWRINLQQMKTTLLRVDLASPIGLFLGRRSAHYRS